MFCPKCAHSNAEKANFCELCGTRLAAPTEEQAVLNGQEAAAPNTAPAADAQEQKAESPFVNPVPNGTTVYYNAPAPVQPKSNGVAIASLICSCVSFVFFCFPAVGISLAIAGAICGIIGIKTPGKGMAIAGLIIGCVHILLVVLFWLLVVAGLSSFDFTAFYDLI